MTSFFRRLFGASQSNSIDSPPAPAMPAKRDSEPRRPAPSPIPMRVGLGYDVGRVRSTNEDTVLVITGTHKGDSELAPFGLFVVADGMGGHLHGERASSAAAKSLAQSIVDRIYLLLLREVEPAERPPIQETVREAVMEANQRVTAVTPQGGTTLTVALVVGSQLTLAHVGDSRAYIIGPDAMEQVTRDHSLVQRLQELGQLSAKEALVHPQRNILTRALGQGDGLEVDLATHYLEPGAKILLCSDGLWSVIPEETILSLVDSSPGVQEACNRLVEAALESGGPDNISALLVEITG